MWFSSCRSPDDNLNGFLTLQPMLGKSGVNPPWTKTGSFRVIRRLEIKMLLLAIEKGTPGSWPLRPMRLESIWENSRSTGQEG
jgi:hypothetical protein